MRVMVLVKATKDSEAGIMPSTELLEVMGKYNEELGKAGVLAGELGGLHPSAKGKRVAFDGPNRTVIDGPFAETKELIAGFWLWEVKDMAEAVEWVKRCPNPMLGPSEIEVRPLFEMADFGEALTPEVAERHNRTREKLLAADGRENSGGVRNSGSLHKSTCDRSLIQQLAPIQDDLWFKVMSLKQNTPCRALGGDGVMPMLQYEDNARLWTLNENQNDDVWQHLLAHSASHPTA